MSYHQWIVRPGAGQCSGCAGAQRVGRRRFLGLLGGGAVLAMAGACSAGARQHAAPGSPQSRSPEITATPPDQATSTTAPPTTVRAGESSVAVGEIPPPQPGPARVVYSGPSGTRQIAITLDDGYCAECVTGYLKFAQDSGLRLTLNPNGMYSAAWTPDTIAMLRDLVSVGQVQIGNHTWGHENLLRLSTSRIADQIDRNEAWIADTFGVTARPYFRPPYGYHDARVREVAGNLGYTCILMWNGTLGDATVETPETLIGLAEKWLQPGGVMLGHMNHPTVVPLLPTIEQIIASRNLEPVTLDEMFSTSRTAT